MNRFLGHLTHDVGTMRMSLLPYYDHTTSDTGSTLLFEVVTYDGWVQVDRQLFTTRPSAEAYFHERKPTLAVLVAKRALGL